MPLEIGMWRVEFRPWGWVRLQEAGGGPTVYLRYERSDPSGHQRFDLRDVVMRAVGDEALSGRVWRRVPLIDLERQFNLVQVTEVLAKHSEVEPPSLDHLAEYFEATESESSITSLLDAGTFMGDGSEGYPEGKFPRIAKPPEGRLTDDFLRDVADAYLWLTKAKYPRPAPAIADMAEVPVRTVHRWIYQARKREILPPAQQGRAG